MANFTMQKDGNTFEFDSQGKVKKNSTDFGVWGTDKTNKVVARPAAGIPVSFDVAWKFNSFNQLCLRTANAADRLIFNFHDSDEVVPFFSISKAVLTVFPDEQNPDFSFELRGEWDLTDTHDLSITINGVSSVIDGYVDDPESRFSYHFFDKARNPFNLIFPGDWSHAIDNKGILKLEFNYFREDGTKDTFVLPEEVTIDRGINQFVYEYDKKNKRRRIRLVGLLKINSSFEITYSIDRQDSMAGNGVEVGSTTFTIGAVLTNSRFQGEMELVVKRPNGDIGKSILGIRGKFTAAVGLAQIQAGFMFAQERQGQMTMTTFLFNGKLTLKNSLTEVQWEFSLADNVKTFAITISDVKLGSAVNVDAKLVVRSAGGTERSVLILLGVRF